MTSFKLIRIQIWNGSDWVDASADASTSSIQTIAYPHHEIHAGKRYHYSDIQTVGVASIEYLIETPAGTEEQHLTWLVTGTDVTTVEWFSGSTRTGDNDVTAEVLNHNFRSGNTTSITLDDSIAGGGADGTFFWRDHGGSGTGPFQAGNVSSERDEWILDASDKYLLRVTSGAVGNLISVHLDFYEHTPDN
jgi:hypothetical protein